MIIIKANSINSLTWENIFSCMHNGVVVVDRKGNIVVMNAAAKKLLQAENGNWEGKHIQELVPHTKILEVVESGDRSIGQKMILADRQCMVNRTPLYQNGKRIGAISVIQDITEIEQYRSLLTQLEAIIEFSTDGLYVVDQEGITIYVNSAYEEITGFERTELVGRHMRDLMTNGYIDQSVSLLVLEKKKQISIMQKIGGKKDVIVTGNPVFNDQGDVELVVTSVRDITQLNKLRKELEKAKSISEINQNRFSAHVNGSEQMFICNSKKMKNIYVKVKQVAPFPTSVLLTGPSGTGKEVIANFIHHHSQRKQKPFIKVNCGAIPEHLLESELFGYEKGAFTGANKEGKIGLLELADGGTVMLDEVGEMPLSLQVKLLRVLQEKQIQRIGGREPIKLDIRFISATNKDLKQLVSEGKFREDLYYRLHVVEITVPPLSERQEDISPLIDHFFSYFCKLYHVDKTLSKETKKALTSYHWPGNVRELKNLIESMIVSVPSQLIEPHHLPLHIHDQKDGEEALTLKQRVEKFEQRIVKDVIKKHPSLRIAAKELGIDHSTLVKKLKRWGLDPKKANI